jgi:hypothetical protein
MPSTVTGSSSTSGSHTTSTEGSSSSSSSSGGSHSGKTSSKKVVNTASHTAVLDKCALDRKGLPIVVISVDDNNNNSNSNQQNKRTYQAFRYEPNMQVWVRIADMRHTLSKLFTVSNIPMSSLYSNQNQQLNMNGTNEGMDILYGGLSNNFETIQNEVSLQNGFDASSVLKLAQLTSSVDRESASMLNKHQEEKSMSNILQSSHNENGFSNSSSNSTDAAYSSSSGSSFSHTNARKDDDQAEVVNKLKSWFDSVTLSHVEEQLSIAVMTGSQRDVHKWFGEWVYLCSKNNLLQRLRFVLESLYQDARRKSSAADSGNSLRASDAKSISETNQSLYLLKYIAIPAIESSNSEITLLNQITEKVSRLL